MEIVVYWMRRDLRTDDNATLFHALKSGHPVLPLFIFDPEFATGSPKDDKRLMFLYLTLKKLKAFFETVGSTLFVRHGDPEDLFDELFHKYDIKEVFAGIDYEPYSGHLDERIKRLCNRKGAKFNEIHDHVVFDPTRIIKQDGTPYQIFTPYCQAWLKEFHSRETGEFPSENLLNNLIRHAPVELPLPENFEISTLDVVFPSLVIPEQIITDYHLKRDYPAMDGTTHLGIHLRFGTISARKLAVQAQRLNPVFLKELIWREFYQMILYHYPKVVTRSFKPAYDQVKWINRTGDFEAWCEGRTGYPLVDAGMRQLIQSGFMHNRLRMVTASFLTKHLLVDWRLGESFFAKYLLDYELASNNGGWQWASGSGCDAAPYYRIFSPQRQQEKFDNRQLYIRQWLPDYNSAATYRKPIVDHNFARARALEFMRKALGR